MDPRVSPPEDPTAAERSHNLLESNQGHAVSAAAAAAWATLAVAEAIDRQTAVLERIAPEDPSRPPAGWTPPGVTTGPSQRCACYGHEHVADRCALNDCTCPGPTDG